MAEMRESERMKQVYDQRKASAKQDGRYNILRPNVLENQQYKERMTLSYLARKISSFSDLRIIELGAGGGTNLLSFLIYGARPQNIFYNEMLEDRIEYAKGRLPGGVTFLEGDARDIEIKYDGSFDIVYISTVFSSVLDDEVRRGLAQKAWSLLKPGGMIIWYDFMFDNPQNPDVRKVTFDELKALFPEGGFTKKRITLAPPIARRVEKAGRFFLKLFDIPFLRTHLLVVIEKN